MPYKKFQHNIDQLTKDTPLTKIAIAVSGGADSVALLHLTSIWARHNNIELVIMSVDHNLRKESVLENEYVKNISLKLGHKHFQLYFNHDNNFTNLQARARAARYKLMTDLCHELDILTLLTAHHFNDYIENFCIRLKRKSGNFGLSTTPVQWLHNTQILRPLFNIPKQELVDYLTQNNIKWFEDESNLSDKYLRNSIRKELTTDTRYDIPSIIDQQTKINQLVENNLKPELIEAFAESVKFYDFGFTNVNLLKFIKYSYEIKLQLLSFLLIIISGKTAGSRFHSLESILDLLSAPNDFKKTLHGCIIKKIENKLLIYREFGKKKPMPVTLNSNNIWDSRFRCSNITSSQYYITYLELNDYIKIKDYLNLELLKTLTFNNHIDILFTLPVVKIFEKVMAIPHISYYDDEAQEINISFCPEFTSRFIHFC